jgi:hypothetical protein
MTVVTTAVATAATRTDPQSPQHLSQRELIAELEKLYRGKSVRHDIFGRRTALPSEIATWVADMHRRQKGQV